MSKRRKHNEEEEHISESWLIPYADIMTLLLALFIVLYSMNSIDSKKFEDLSRAFNLALSSGTGVLEMPAVIQKGSDLEDIINNNNRDSESTNESATEITQEQLEELIEKGDKELSTLKEEIDEYIQQNGLSTNLETSLNFSQLVITIRDTALFATGETRVNTEGQKLAKSIADMIENYPDFNIVIAGHTDNAPINTREFRSNWDLSVMRAVRFLDIILENNNLEPHRFSSVGYGEHHPVAPNDTPENKAKNRRVEIKIINSYADPEKQQTLIVE